MAQVIRCMSDYFDEKRCDMYHIDFYELKGKSPTLKKVANNEARNMILAWMKKHMPEIKVEPIFTFTWENAGMMGYDGSLCLHFDSESVKKFEARWEDENAESVDERFRLWWTPMWVYLKWHGGKMPEKPNFDDFL